MGTKKDSKRTRTKVLRPQRKKGQLRLKGISGIPIVPTDIDVKIAEGIANGLGKIKSMIEAGIAESNARSNSAEILSRPGVLAAQAMILEKANVNMDRIARVIDEGLKSKKIISANLLVMASYDGAIIDAPEDEGEAEKCLLRVPDYPTRRGYLETAIDVMERVGTMPAKPRDNGMGGGPEMSPGEEKNLIEQAERSVGGRDVSRYMVIRER